MDIYTTETIWMHHGLDGRLEYYDERIKEWVLIKEEDNDQYGQTQ